MRGMRNGKRPKGFSLPFIIKIKGERVMVGWVDGWMNGLERQQY